MKIFKGDVSNNVQTIWSKLQKETNIFLLSEATTPLLPPPPARPSASYGLLKQAIGV